ncbi:MAG TPA: haloalkane dehalogenase [Gaiellaceae bacterium]|nr:haloalkane dehalogenase [Gaiellaceae bacterium]
MDAYRTPDQCFEGLPGYPFAPKYFEQRHLRMHYVDEGSGPPVLLLHGEPTWSYLYRKVIPELLPSARAIAPDYFGFGRSDKPLRTTDYSYDFHVGSIVRLTEELDLRDLTVVVQDWGGPIGLRLAVEHPDRVARLVIMNTGIGGGRPPSDEWLRFRDFVRRVGTDLIPGKLVRISGAQPMSDEVEAAYSAPWPVPESKAGILAFPDLVPISPDHPDTPAHQAVREQLGRWEKPTLVLFGDSDPIFAPRAAERIAEQIPGAGPAELVAGAGHFLQEDKGEEIGRRIARFVLDS